MATVSAMAQDTGSLNSPVRSQDPANFNSKKVLDNLMPHIWQGENLAYTKPADTVARAATEYAKMMPESIQEVVKDKIYHTYGFQIASTLIAIGDDGLIVIDPGSDDDSAKATHEAFIKAVPAAANLPVTAIVYTHRHPDHAFGSAGWGVTQQDVDSGKVKIIASEHFLENLINDVGVVGNILTQRTAYAAGYLPVSAEGFVHGGIGPVFGAGPISFYLPTDTVKTGQPLKLKVSGIDMEVFHAYGDAGTDEVDVYFPEFRHVHGSETIQGETFPNLYTLRGTSYRDVEAWMEGVDILLAYAQKSDTYSGSHMRAWKGNDFITERIRNYRDAIQYVHDQAIYWTNLGYTRDELAEKVVLPEPFASDPWLQEYYGTVAHSVRNIYGGYIGWWEGDPTQLARPAPKKLSEQYVRVMGGRDAILKEGRKAIDNKDYGWAAELLTHQINVDPKDMEARKLKAEALRKWGYLQTNIYWRGFGIAASKELDGTLDRSQPWNFADPAIVKVLPTKSFLKTMRVRLNADRAADAKVNVQFVVSDTNEAVGFKVRNKIAAFIDGKMAKPDATITGTKLAILKTIATGKLAEGVTVSGDKAAATKFLGLFDIITPNDVNLVLPPGTPLK
ncbi:MBL fold metallo-hydrolase [Microbulbifer sp. CAU 1566]|uniref:alkyl sulfatase dimerization domain-containing protein n=1 Tax=Microbulbifer sp. CAU 1566 TaxID=2933269 RepID=UPI0020060726|nr:alkyl sulfatase dimerization domain-containing protein [Microbulbifer sp. CAU 1566]MCK7598971.1 MBL fold metallo-hydrolase [Microbulbifer sp. CAU 1566]